MKNLFVLALALIMSCTFAFAQSQSPYSKGKSFGKKTIECAITEDDNALERLCTDIESYCQNYIETEEDFSNFLEGFKSGIYAGCEQYDLGEDIAETAWKEFATVVFEELLIGSY